MNGYFWTTLEISMLRELYPQDGGIDKLRELLGRSRQSITQRANILGLKAPRQKSTFTARATDAEADTKIKALYGSNPQRGDIGRLAEELNRPRLWVCRRALKLGLSKAKVKEPDWHEQELDILYEHHFKRTDAIKSILLDAGFRRSETAIDLKRRRMKLGCKRDDSYSTTDLAALLGVSHKTVIYWIEILGLKATRKSTNRTNEQGGNPYEILASSFRLWVFNNAARVDLCKADKYWFIDLMKG